MCRDLSVRDLRMFSLFQDPGQEILAIDLALDSPIISINTENLTMRRPIQASPLHKLPRVRFMFPRILQHLLDVRGEYCLQDGRKPCESLKSVRERSLAQTADHDGNPRVFFAWQATTSHQHNSIPQSTNQSDQSVKGKKNSLPTRLDPAKTLPKCQTANDIKRCQIEHIHQLHLPFPIPFPSSNLLNKLIHNLRNQILLLPQTPLGKRAREILAHLAVFLRVPLADNGERLGGEVAAVVEVGFDEDVVVGAEAVDVVPGAGGVEGEFVGGDADDGACLGVWCQFLW